MVSRLVYLERLFLEGRALMTWRLICVLALCATTAMGAPKRVVVAGPAGLVRAVETSLGKSATVIRQSALPGEPPSKTLVEIARSANAGAVVVIADRNGSAAIDVFNGADGAALTHIDVRFSKKTGLRSIPKAPLGQLQRAIASGKAPGAVVPERVADVPVKREPVATPPKPVEREVITGTSNRVEPEPDVGVVADGSPPATTEGSREIVKAEVGGRTFQRSLSWRDDLFQRMPAYQLPLGPAVTVDAEFYPLALVTKGALAGLGLTGTFEQSIGIASTDADMQRYATTAQRFRAGLLFALPVDRFTFTAQGGWSMQSFTFSSTSSAMVARVNIPNVRYGAVRAGLKIGVQIVGPISFELGGAYQAVLSSGEIGSASFFKNATVGGADMTAAVSWRIIKNVEAKLGAEYQRYWFSLNPQPGDPWIAGGALDEYKSLRLSLAWVL
jgi:hypothetical protein